jgi:hypothetical protein
MPAAVKVIEDGHRWGRRGTEAVVAGTAVVAVIANRRTFWPHGLQDPDQLNIDRE